MRKGPHPVWFAILIAPYGAAFSYVALALPFLAVKAGVAAEVMGGVLALAYVPHSWKFLWAPVVDTTLSRRAWYAIALALTCGGIVLASSIPISPSSIPLITLVVVGSQIGLTLLAMSGESFLALGVPEAEKGRAAGWYNAGIFVGGGVGGWAVLKLTAALPAGWMAGAVVGGVLALCYVATLFIPMPPRDLDHPRLLSVAMRELLRDLKGLVVSRIGLTGLAICLVPVGAGAMSNLFNSVADRWGVVDPWTWTFLGITLEPDDIVGAVNGLIGGLISAGGAMVGGFLADRLPRRLNYALAGSMTALCSIFMALAPRAPWAYVVFGLTYSFFVGVAYAAFSSFVLETIGKGAVATKYNIFASLANIAISYTTLANSRALGRYGTTGMLLTDAALTFGGIVVLLTLFTLVKPRSPAA